MQEVRKKFHELALKSILFKGRSQLYYCYLKAERIAHVLFILQEKSDSTKPLSLIAEEASALPREVVFFVTGELHLSHLVASIFSLLSLLRLAVTQGKLTKE